MAEKRYREAAEMYADNSKGSAVMLNKTGIAYHQMLQLNLAEKYYRHGAADGSQVRRSGEQSWHHLLRKEELPARGEPVQARVAAESAISFRLEQPGDLLLCAEGLRKAGRKHCGRR